MLSKLKVSPAPHIGGPLSTRVVMLDVIIGLLPAVAMAFFYFRHYAAVQIGSCVVACVLTEMGCNRIRRKPSSIDDLSAVVTGIILGLSLPPAAPWWVGVIGGFFAIAITKMVFGGLGGNVFNPAMAARAFLTASFGLAMTTWTLPATIDSDMPELSAANRYGQQTVQAVSQATPLGWAKQVIKGKADAGTVKPMLSMAFKGETGGCVGETSAIALLIGGIYLLLRKTITFHVPVAVLGSAFVFAEIAHWINPEAYVPATVHIAGGGMMMCAFFIATDPVTMPLTRKGMWIFGIGVGALIMLIRVVGEYPEGVMYAVLTMNAVTPLIDRFCKLTPIGGPGSGK